MGACASLGSYGIALWAMTRAPTATEVALRLGQISNEEFNDMTQSSKYRIELYASMVAETGLARCVCVTQ